MSCRPTTESSTLFRCFKAVTAHGFESELLDLGGLRALQLPPDPLGRSCVHRSFPDQKVRIEKIRSRRLVDQRKDGTHRGDVVRLSRTLLVSGRGGGAIDAVAVGNKLTDVAYGARVAPAAALARRSPPRPLCGARLMALRWCGQQESPSVECRGALSLLRRRGPLRRRLPAGGPLARRAPGGLGLLRLGREGLVVLEELVPAEVRGLERRRRRRRRDGGGAAGLPFQGGGEQRSLVDERSAFRYGLPKEPGVP